MKQIVILSGKGGTGKTTISAALGHMLSQRGSLTMADADVDAPNLAIILRPTATHEEPFYGGFRAYIDAARCIACGRCAEVCRFEAVQAADDAPTIDSLACEGCGACATQCPVGAIQMQEYLSGHWARSETRFGPFVHARLTPGAENSGKLVSRVRAEALILAEGRSADWVLVDGAPGTGCPVIAAVTGSDLALMVTEPTLSALHDLERALRVAEHFGVPTAVCVNKCDINPEMTEAILRRCNERGTPVLAQIPYDDVVLEAMRQARAVTELGPSVARAALYALSQGLGRLMG